MARSAEKRVDGASVETARGGINGKAEIIANRRTPMPRPIRKINGLIFMSTSFTAAPWQTYRKHPPIQPILRRCFPPHILHRFAR